MPALPLWEHNPYFLFIYFLKSHSQLVFLFTPARAASVSQNKQIGNHVPEQHKALTEDEWINTMNTSQADPLLPTLPHVTERGLYFSHKFKIWLDLVHTRLKIICYRTEIG